MVDNILLGMLSALGVEVPARACFEYFLSNWVSVCTGVRALGGAVSLLPKNLQCLYE